MSEKHHIMCPPGALNGTLHREGARRARPFSGLCGVPHPTLFQIMLVASLLATVLGKCGPPPMLSFAHSTKELNQTEFQTDTVLKYTCRPGYTRISSQQSLTCKADGQWQYNVFCIKKRCRNPGDLAHGVVEVQTDFSLGSKIEFSCSEGYVLVGPATSVCEIQDKGIDWRAPFPVCEIVKCKSPPDISNGKHSSGEEELYTYGSSVTYSCDPNYSLLGNASISCLVENKTVGVWSPSPPTCKHIICRQPTIAYAKIVSGFRPIYTFKDSIVFSCQTGFILKGSNVIRCEADNNWNPSPPICEPHSCVGLPDISNASWDDHSRPRRDFYTPGTTLRYRCYPGYKPATNEPTTVTCQNDLKWSPFKGCKKVCCPTPGVKNGGSIETRGSLSTDCPYSYNEVIYYRCPDEWQRRSAKCQSDGTWNTHTPLCGQGCDVPPSIPHGHHEQVPTYSFFSPSFVYKCDEGYKLVGQEKISCRDSQWSSEAPQCKALCLKPKIEHGKLSVNKLLYIESDNVTIRCDSGFGVVGPQSITCSENRSWYPAVPKCEWEIPEGCEQVLTGRKLMQCLSSPAEVQMALELHKLSLEIELLRLQIDKARQSDVRASL